MRDYVILTDSCCDFSQAMVEELGVQILPLSFVLEGQEYKNYPDNHEMDPGDFYARLRGGALGSTSAVNVGVYKDAMTELVQSGKDVLCICFSSGLSTTYQSAVIAAQDVRSANPECGIAVVNSRAASLGQGLLVYLAVQEKNKGRSMEEVRAYTEDLKDHICHWFTVDDLNHLKRGGRVSTAAALFGTMLQMKPVLHVDNAGRLIPITNVRGRKASIKALVDMMDQLVEDPSTVFISHGDCLEDAKTLAEMVKAKYPVQRLEINYVGPVIGNHSGPGTLALFFVGKHK